ncbi:hypothetical protein ADIWIN_3679 [Winogradskyella psychrotolerans RS-3]|uniref:YhhN-like protein n=2 Tax=Winogradskyella TaxID=286104 RepID=S7X2H4_9FLAO|nr:hypothetical protein ADIWIN_3679 [Winogradskyella psychrotolerans RS-3]
MAKKREVSTRYFKKITIIDSIFYMSFFATIVVSICLERAQLVYVLPVVIFSIFFKYISLTKKRANPLFLIALLAILVSDVLSMYCFEACFVWVSIFASAYLICCALSLKKYLHKGKLKSVLSFSVIVSAILISYVIYAIVDLLMDFLPGIQLFFVLLSSVSLVIYTITVAIIYIRDAYHNSTLLLASSIFTFFQITLIAINEFLFYDKTFTVLAVSCHIMALYLFMNFIAKTEVVKPEDIKEKFI